MLLIALLALWTLPFVSAAPLDLLGGIRSGINRVSNGIGNIVNGPFGPILPINQIVKNPKNIVQSVNDALGNILPRRVDSRSRFEDVLSNIHKQLHESEEISATFAGLFQAIVQARTPNSIPDTLQRLEKLLGNGNAAVTLENVGLALLDGLSVTDLTQNVLASYLPGINSFNNSNPAVSQHIYPRAADTDPLYTIDETSLRSALYIPPSFTYGRKRPILFVPGTGAFAGVNFASNLGKLLSRDYDITYLNVPGAMCNDIQLNAEYIAYATHYLSALTARTDIAIIGWSQGNLASQWVFQYWPSTRNLVTDLISLAADFHGTTLAYFLSPTFPLPSSTNSGHIIPNPPSVLQQQYSSTFITTFLANGGRSPYVPSTSIWSITDEIVQPQYDPYASAAYFSQDLPDSREIFSPPTCRRPDPQQPEPDTDPSTSIPYTNNQIQTICKGQPAGGFYPHEGVLYNPLAYALVLSALTHPGPGSTTHFSATELAKICSQVVAPGLSLPDVLATEGLIPLAAVNLLLYPGKVLNEPAVREYALKGEGCDS